MALARRVASMLAWVRWVPEITFMRSTALFNCLVSFRVDRWAAEI